MKRGAIQCSLFLTTVVVVPAAQATTYYVSPDGTDPACTRAAPCSLETGVSTVQAGDTVVLMDGTYKSRLLPTNSGTANAWITFQADECALPIIEGDGEANPTLEDGNMPSGVWADTATYIRFIGLVSRGWDSGFSNGWTGNATGDSNGHWEIKNCIGDGNGRTGFTFYSAQGIHVSQSISAHNGGSQTDSWSSGVTLYAAQGSGQDNVIESVVSFENIDNQKHSDGSGFIADEHCQGTSFINCIGFRNGGSCLRLTKSPNTRIINLSCYHNGQDPAGAYPDNPDEFYFTSNETTQGVTFINTIAAASGSSHDAAAVYGQPSSGVSNNLFINNTGSQGNPFMDPEGTNPDFRAASSVTGQVQDKGSSSGAPTTDIGFDPKCIVKRTPTVMYRQSWWQYSVDYEYIKSIGGVAKCFNPKNRSGTPDIGAYEVGEITTLAPNSCVPPEIPTETGGAPGTGGAAGAGGTTPGAGGATPGAGGTTPGAGGTTPGAGGTTPGAGGTTTPGAGGTTPGAGGTTPGAGGTTPGAGGTTTPGAGGTTPGAGGTTTPGAGGTTTPGAVGGSGGSATGAASGMTGAGGSAAAGAQFGAAAASPTGAGATTGVPGAAGTAAGTTESDGGCGCRVAAPSSRSGVFAALGLLGVVLLRTRRRRFLH